MIFVKRLSILAMAASGMLLTSGAGPANSGACAQPSNCNAQCACVEACMLAYPGQPPEYWTCKTQCEIDIPGNCGCPR